jgi:hypothetical protein
MSEYSLYEKNHPRRMNNQNGVAMGRITKVYAAERQVEVKTFFGAGSLNDNHIPKAQWLTADGHPDGDESGSIPRVGSMCLVHFINGEPFVHGMLKPLSKKGSAVRDSSDTELEELSDGDRVFKTNGYNKIILRANGEIQIQSTEGCRTLLSQENDLINHICRNYEFYTAGGYDEWLEIDPDKNLTNRTIEYRDNGLERTNVMIDEFGTMVDESEFFYRRSLGPGGPDAGITNTVYTETIKPSGERDVLISTADSDKGYHLNITPDGETQLNIADSLNLNVKPTGEVLLDINEGNLNLNLKPSGETLLNVADKHKYHVYPSGKTELNVADQYKYTVLPSGEVTMEVSSGAFKLNITPIGTCTISAGKGAVQVELTAAGTFSLKSSSGASIVAGSGQIELGSSGVGVIAQLADTLQTLADFAKTAVAHSHISPFFGIPTSPPMDPSPWVKLGASATKTMGLVNSVKGKI